MGKVKKGINFLKKLRKENDYEFDYDMLGSGYQAMQKDEARAMAEMVETWLGNPISKKILRFCTKRCSCGRRIDVALRSYVGEDLDLCFGCKTTSMIIKNVIDFFINKSKVDEEYVLRNLRDPVWRKGLASVLEGIAAYGPQKPFTAYSPFLVVWNITRACNLQCKHCYEDAHIPRRDELAPEQRLVAVDKMAEEGVAYIAISGGEPLMLRDFFDVAKRIQENDMGFSIATNATLLTKENVKKLKELNCRFIQISLDGSTARTHDFLRGRGVFRKTIQGIKNAAESNIVIGVATTVTKHNYKDVPNIIDLAENLGVKIFMNYNFIPTGRGSDIMRLDLTPQEREDLLTLMASQNKDRKITLLTTAPQYARICSSLSNCKISMTHFDIPPDENVNIDDNSLQFLAEFIGGCGTSRLYCALEPNGDIEPCVFIPIKVGNIMQDDFLDVWHNNEILQKIRARHEFKGVCGSCKHRNICGGCRARAYGYFKDVTASDPGCILAKDEWEELSKIKVRVR